MNEDERLIIDVRRLLPQVALRMRILEHMRKNWASVVGPAPSRHSKPYDFIKNDLYIAVDSTHTAQVISNMKGNISRVLANRYDYHEEIELKITAGERHEDKAQPAKSHIESKQAVNVSDSLVNEDINECPESLSNDAKFAMSHLMAYLESLQSLRSRTLS